MATCSIDSLTRADQCVLTAVGEVDLGCADNLAALGLLAIADQRVTTLIIDLSGVTFIDSTGIGALVRIRNHAVEDDKRLVLRGLSAPVLRIIRVTGLEKVFCIQASNGTKSSV